MTTPTSGEPAPVDPWCTTCRRLENCRVDVDECKRQHGERSSAKSQRVTAALSGINVGARYRSMTFDDFHPVDEAARKIGTICRRYAETFGDRLRNCDNILMLGNPGTGKNMLAACICSHIAGEGFTAVHTTTMRLVRKIRESWRKESDVTEQSAINQFSLPDLLVIDEVGVQYGSSGEEILLFEVINERYEAMRPTIIISNLDVAGVEKYLGARIIDRFHEGKSSVLEFTWDSYRRQKC